MHTHLLPQRDAAIFISDGGIETTLIFHEGLELPYFAAFDLLKNGEGRAVLRRYFRTYAEIARRHQVGLVLESPTWRANSDWAAKLGYSAETLARANREAIGLMREIQETYETAHSPMVISGCLGPRGDGYQPSVRMSAEEAAQYHMPQLRTFRDAGADHVSAITMNYFEEALGIAQAAAALEIPAVISFTVETDGRLPDGLTLREAIEIVDQRSARKPAYYMINCAHPTHFAHLFTPGETWTSRIHGLRANASCRSHAELDASPDLDDGNPVELAEQYRQLRTQLPNLTIFGGCCGTDHRHIDSICHACLTAQEVR